MEGYHKLSQSFDTFRITLELPFQRVFFCTNQMIKKRRKSLGEGISFLILVDE
jgi:hypothetical protein